MRSPEELARLAQIMLGIHGSTIEEALDYAQMVEIRNEYNRMAEAELEQELMMAKLSGNNISEQEITERWYAIRQRLMLSQGQV